MRNNLGKLKSSEIRVFTGVLCGKRYQRQLIKNVYLLDKNGKDREKFIGDHCLVATKPFNKFNQGSYVRFTGIPHEYIRSDKSRDYEIIVNKARLNESVDYKKM